MIPTFEYVDEILKVTDPIKVTEQYFPVVVGFPLYRWPMRSVLSKVSMATIPIFGTKNVNRV